MRYTFRLIIISKIITIILALIIAPIPVQGADATVNTCDFASLQAAVATANAGGGIIDFTCNGTFTFTSTLTISDNVVINGNGITNTIFDGNGAVQLFSVGNNASLTLDALTIRNGNHFTNGGAIFVNGLGALTITNSAFSNNNTALQGGAVSSYGGAVNISNSTFIGNSSMNGVGGALFIDQGALLNVSNSTFSNNTASGSGANGGAIWVNSTNGIIMNSDFTNNQATNGGAIRSFTFGTASLTISNSSFTNNTAAGDGGAISNITSTVVVNNSSFTGNTAQNDGGAILNTGTFTINNSTISGNTANANGGGVNNTGTFILNGVTISGNSAPYIGGFRNNSATAVDSTDTDYINNDCSGTFNDLGGNTVNNAPDCPGVIVDPPVTPEPEPEALAPVVLLPDPFALGCVVTLDIDLMNATDNTYCRILMRHGNVVNYSGAVPDSLIGLGVKLAVDVYRLDGGQSVVDFGEYARVCLSGTGRLFYLDARQSPRSVVELATESIGGATCGWIPAAGTLVLTD